MTGISKSSGLLKPSFISAFIILITVAYITISYNLWSRPNAIIRDDVNHYYSYLPAVFIYHDIKLDFIDRNIDYFAKHYWPLRGPKGGWVIVTTMGLSLMYAPFFLMFHYPMQWMGMEALGYSPPYQLALVLSSLFYFAVGLFYLRKILLYYFSEWPTAITMATVVLSTNLVFYVTDEPAMSHAYNFVLMTMFLYYTIRWSEKQSIKHAIVLGLLAGMISLIRPTNILVILVLAVWNVDSFRALWDRILLFIKKSPQVAIMFAAAILVWVPQMLYWKYVTGHYFYFSYSDKGKFFFDNPQIYQTLFGYRKGWLLYTPVMAFAILGLFFLFRKYRKLFFPVLIFMIANIWVISSWWLWWYGGSYGMRAYVDSYGILAIPFAAFVAWSFENRKWYIQVLNVMAIGLFTFHNYFQICQYHNSALHYVSMTKEAYWDSFGHKHPSLRFGHLLSYPDYKSAEKGIYPEPKPDPLYTGKLGRKECVIIVRGEVMSSLFSNRDYLLGMMEKAKSRNISLDSLVTLDAEWILQDKIYKGMVKVKE